MVRRNKPSVSIVTAIKDLNQKEGADLDERYLTLEYLVKEMLNMKEKRDLDAYIREERPKPPPVPTGLGGGMGAWYPPPEHYARPDHRRQASYT